MQVIKVCWTVAPARGLLVGVLVWEGDSLNSRDIQVVEVEPWSLAHYGSDSCATCLTTSAQGEGCVCVFVFVCVCVRVCVCVCVCVLACNFLCM